MDMNFLKQLSESVPAPVNLNDQLITVQEPDRTRSAPLMVTPGIAHVDLAGWLSGHQDWTDQQLRKYGGVLFRGFDLQTTEAFQKAFAGISASPLHYTNRTSPRTAVFEHIYTSTDYPSDQKILMHTESSYAVTWPSKIAFFCLQPPASGGETPVADVRKVFQALSPETIRKFEEKKVMYIRNMNKGIGLSWQEVYQTADKKTVEAYLQEQHMAFEWKNEDHLRIWWVKPALRKHPLTDEWIWFNHAYFYHKTNLEPDLVEFIAEEDLPFTARYGDGSPIEDEVIKDVDKAYESTITLFPWQKGDLLLLDNMLMAHGRQPFTGSRKILVAMGDPMNETL